MKGGGHSEFWTPFRRGYLRRLWKTDLPSSEIAKRLGCSKNAACGKAGRLGLPPKPPVLTSTSKRARKFKSAVSLRGCVTRAQHAMQR